MPKRKGSIWNHWTVVQAKNSDGSGNDKPSVHPSVKCNYCFKIFDRAVPKRMQAHLDKKCSKAPDNAKSHSELQNTISMQSFQILPGPVLLQ